MLNLIKRHRLGIVLLLVGSVGMVFLAVTPARAGHVGCSPSFYNRCSQHGYFTNREYHMGGAGTYVMSTGGPTGVGGMPVNNVNEFVGFIHNRLHDGSPVDKYQDTTGAAFIINTMLGRWGSDYGSRDAGVIYARNNFSEWEKRVRWYDSQGLVDWHTFRRHANFDNSLYDHATGDDVFYRDNRLDDDQFIVLFYTPGHGPASSTPQRDFIIKKNCGNPIGSTPGLRPVPQPEGVIQGFKVANPGLNSNIEPPKSALITSSHKGGRSTRDNAYFFTDVPADDDGPGGPNRAFHRVTAEVPAGWRVGYNVCYNNNQAAGWRNPCDNGRDGVTWSNTVVVDVYVGNPVNVWWHYERLTPPAPTINAQCTNGTVSAQISWSTSALPATSYMLDVDDANNFNQFWNKAIPQGTSSTDSPAGFNPYPSGGGPLVLQRGQQYFVRVYYVNSNQHSQVASFTAPSCWQFNVPKPTARAQLNPDESDPQNVDLSAGFSVNYGPSGAPNPQGVRLVVTRSFFIRKANGSIVALTPSPSPSPDNRWFNGVDANGHNYQENRSIPPSFTVGDQVCITITVSPGSGSVDSNGNVTSPGPAVSSDEGCAKFMNKSYFKVFGGDISAGSIECRGWSAFRTPGMITAYNSTSTPGKGSGAQLAALAIGAIHEFSSATGRTPAPTPPKGLSFANVAASGAWGGEMVAGGSCPQDYFGTQPTTREFVGSDINLSGWNGSLRTAAGVRVSGVVDLNKRVTLYVDGDVVISNNISYAGVSGGWNYSEMPNFTLVARGNVFIGANVTELAGIFIAQPKSLLDPDTEGGEIYTCAFGTTPPTESQLTRVTGTPGSDNCRNQLTIYGSFIAKRIRLLRTNGSLSSSSPNETRDSATMAEKFIFSPEAWLSSSISPAGGFESYDSITTLPPIL